MTVEFLLAVLGPGLLGGAAAYLAWSRLDAKRQAPRKSRLRSAEDPPMEAGGVGDTPVSNPDTAADKKPLEGLVFRKPGAAQQAEGEGNPAARIPDRPSGASAVALAETEHAQAEPQEIAALREDLAELATSLLTVHEAVTEQVAKAQAEAPAIIDLSAQLTTLTEALTTRLAPERLAEEFAPLLQPPPAAIPDAVAALPAKMEQLASALATALGNLPEELRRAVAEARTPAPDLARIEADIAALAARPDVPPPTPQAVLEPLRDQLAAIAETVAAQDTPGAQAALMARLTGLDDRLTAIGAAASATALDERLARLEERIAAVGIEPGRLASLEERIAEVATGAAQAVAASLTDRLPASSDRIEQMAAAIAAIGNPQDAVARLEGRLATMETTMIEEIRDLALLARGGYGMPAGQTPPPANAATPACPDATSGAFAAGPPPEGPEGTATGDRHGDDAFETVVSALTQR